jgi:hypothetical protein
MYHSRKEVIERTTREYEKLEALVSNLTDEQWERSLERPETKDPWTVKDSLAHITHWKADVIRSMKRKPQPAEEKGLNETDGNHLVFERWHNRPAEEVLQWHRQTQEEVIQALKEAPEEWFSKREHKQEWPFDLEGHSSYHRVKDIERAVEKHSKR